MSYYYNASPYGSYAASFYAPMRAPPCCPQRRAVAASPCAQACAKPACPQPAAAQNCCQPRQRTEMIQIPHYISTIHTQPITRKWMTEEVSYNQVPVTQEVRNQPHPNIDMCTSAPVKSCN